MKSYQFTHKEKTYTLSEENCSALYNDESKPIAGIDFDGTMDLLNSSDEVHFDIEYYDSGCEKCRSNRTESSKYYHFLEFHFYLFSKAQQYIMSSLSPNYESNSFNKLERSGVVDAAYMVSILLCPECSDYMIDIELCDF